MAMNARCYSMDSPSIQAILVTADYKWSLRRVQYGTVDYQDTLIKVASG